MKRYLNVLVLAVSALMILVACSASTPQDQMKEIDELLTAGFPISPEQMEGIDEFIEQGKSLLNEGKTEEAGKAFNEAITILKMAQDADIFNKAD